MKDEEKKSKKIMKIEDSYDNTEYFLETFKQGDEYIHFRIKESNVYSPLTFENDYTMEDFYKVYKGFKSCDYLDEILKHLYILFDDKKAELIGFGSNKEKYLYFKLTIFHRTEYFKIVLKRTE